MITWAHYYYETQRYESFRREAEQARLLRQAFPKPATGASLHHRALFWFGCRLTTWGCRLIERNGGVVDATAPTCQIRPIG